MSVQTLYRWGAVFTIMTAPLFAAAVLALIVGHDGEVVHYHRQRRQDPLRGACSYILIRLSVNVP